MATPKQRQEKIDEAKKLISELAGIKASTLSRTEDLSRDINFSEAVPFFEEMLDIIKQLSQRDISRLGLTQLNQIIAGCNQLSKLIKSVNDFTLNQNTPADICKDIIATIKKVLSCSGCKSPWV